VRRQITGESQPGMPSSNRPSQSLSTPSQRSSCGVAAPMQPLQMSNSVQVSTPRVQAPRHNPPTGQVAGSPGKQGRVAPTAPQLQPSSTSVSQSLSMPSPWPLSPHSSTGPQLAGAQGSTSTSSASSGPASSSTASFSSVATSASAPPSASASAPASVAPEHWQSPPAQTPVV
jgi:hypothetical protein